MGSQIIKRSWNSTTQLIHYLQRNVEEGAQQGANNRYYLGLESAHGDRSEGGSLVDDLLNSRYNNSSWVSANDSITQVIEDDKIHSLNDRDCPLHKHSHCIISDAERIEKKINIINRLRQSNNVHVWIKDVINGLGATKIDYVIKQALLLKADEIQEKQILVCPHSEDIIIRFFMKTIDEKVKNYILKESNSDFGNWNSVTVL